MIFYTNKYPLGYAIYNNKTDKHEALPIGTVFTIKSISGDCFDLTPINKIDGFESVMVRPEMLEAGFTSSNYLVGN